MLSEALTQFLDDGTTPDPLPATDKESVPVVLPMDVSNRLDAASAVMGLPYSWFANSAIQLFLNKGKTDER